MIIKVREVISDTHAASLVMRSENFSEEEKEKEIRKIAIRMIVAFVSVSVRTMICVLLAYGVVLAGVEMSLFDMDSVMTAALNWYFIIFSTAVAFLAFKYIK